ncbi:MAG TPA: LytTR family DNA-binding domain-containing protein [Pyrinomonadaceae bacterium]
MKPVNPERLKLAIERLSAPDEKAEKTLETDDFLFVNTGRQSKFIKASSIKCIAAADVYSEIFTEDGAKCLVLKPLGEWERKLPAKTFMRIHRSTIINLEFLERIDRRFDSSQRVYLRGIAEPFAMSRRYAAKLKGKPG